MQVLIVVAVVCLFVASPNLLFVFGVGYASPAASAFEKIHPSTYIAVLTLPLLWFARELDVRMKKAALLMIVTSIAGLAWIARTASSGGGESSALVVTFLSPGLFAYLLMHTTDRTLSTLNWVIFAFLLLNSLLGVIEALSGFRLLPFVLSEEVITWDTRPTALLGHPLTNSFITGLCVLLLVMKGFRTHFGLLLLVAIGLHGLAMTAFGGRAALVAMAVIAGFYVLFRAARGALTRRDGRDVLRLAGGIYALIVCIPLLLASGAADAVIDRFIDSRGSDETRYAAIQMLSSLTTNEWFIGIPISTRTALQTTFGSEHGIELSWIALILQFGLPLSLALLFATWRLLRSSLVAGVDRQLLLIYFFSTTFISLSIASKSLLISQSLLLFATCSWRTTESKPAKSTNNTLSTQSEFGAF